MKLTRKHLNYILHSLPDPRLVELGAISPMCVIPVHKVNELIRDALLANHHSTEIHELSFLYDKKEQDWVLQNLDI